MIIRKTGHLHHALLTCALVLPATLALAETAVYPDRDPSPDSLVTEPRGVTPDPGQNVADEVADRALAPDPGDIPGPGVADRIHGYRTVLDGGVPDKPVTKPRGATPRPGINRDVVQ